MAKTQLKNYVFKPGIGFNDNRFPNAYGLLSTNKAFIQKEAGAYITDKVANAQQYTPTGATYAPATGVLTITIGTHNFNVGDALLIALAGITFRCELDGNATTHPYPRVTDPVYQKAIPITAITSTSVTVNVGISSDTSVHTFDSANANAVSDVFYNYTNDSEAKCERDIGYVIDAYLADLKFGGNENIRDVIKYYWDQTVAQVDGDRGAEIATHNFIGRLITDYIFTKTTYAAENTQITQTVTGNDSETLQQFTASGADYQPTTGQMTLTIGTHTLTAGDEIHIAPGGITFTCFLDGNATLHPYPRATGVPNDTGKDPYYYAPITITEVTSNTITVNVGISSDTSVHTFDSAVANSITAGPSAKIDTIVFNTTDVIANGLSGMPKFVATGVGTIKVQGKYDVNELLIITNATKSEVVYNFTNIATGATVSISDIYDPEFLKFKETTDGVTTIKLNYNTSTHLESDDIQIFVEEPEVRTRPFDFGTDAIERPRAALPVSMLDADFEYGLQPTKWSAIGTLRGYPSVYEIPGTDASVARVVTDASLSEPTQTFTGSVTNDGTSNWTWSSALDRNGNVTGADPAITLIEGDILIITNNAGASHPLFIKTVAGSGTGNQVSNVLNQGTVSAGNPLTWATQPGDAGTYYYQCSSHANMNGTITVLANNTGTGIGQSLITVTTVGSHGFNPGTPVSLKALENSIAGASRAEGTFIIVATPSVNTFQYFAKAKVGTVAGQLLSTGYTQLREAGFYTGASIGAPSFDISSNGSSGTMFAELDVLAGETVIPFDGSAPEIASPLSQVNIPLGSQATGIVDQSSGGGTYVSPLTSSNTAAGQNQMQFQDSSGIVNNLAIDRGDGNAIYVTDVSGNTVTFNDNFTREIIGNRNDYTGITPDNDENIGSLAKFDISYSVDSSFSYVLADIENDGIQYEIGDKIIIPGTLLGGASPANDCTVSVTSVGSDNSIATASLSGLHFNNDIYLADQTATFTGGLGSGAQVDFAFLDGNYTSVAISSTEKGSGYKVGDVLQITADIMVPGYSGPERNLYISVDGVSSIAGAADTVSLLTPGSGYSDGTTVNTTTAGSGTGLTLTITTDVTNTDQVASAVIAAPGSGYSQFDVVTLSTGNGDSTFRVDSVSQIGAIDSITFAGSAPSINKTFVSPAYTSTTASGIDADFDVEITGDSYQVTFTNNGANYLPTETITVAGTTLGGVSPGNDLTITIDNVGASGDITVTTDVGNTYNGDTLAGLPATNLTPTGATFNVDQNADGAFNAVISNPGDSGYNVNQTHTISGVLFGGTTPANDLTIQITAISDLEDGEVTGVSVSGAGYIPGGVYTDVEGTNNVSAGAGAIFSLTRDAGNYSNFVVTNPGADYESGNRLEIEAGLVDGIAPLQDIRINITGVDAGGAIVSFTTSSVEASFGENIDLISTVTMSEATTGPIAKGSPINFSAIAQIEASFSTAHGLVPGDTFITSVNSDDGTNNHNLAAGSYIATEIPSVTTLRFNARTIGSIDNDGGNDPIIGQVFPRPDSFFIHRPFDGGVQLGTGGPQHGSQAIRQSKKYIRYQSGKGIMYTTGALFAPSYDIRSVTADGIEVGSEITIVTDDNDHGCQVGGIIRLLGIDTPGYSSGNETAVPPKFDYEVTEIVDERTFKVLSKRRLGATEAVLGFGAQMSVVAWHGATVRSGIFDDQNGIFWEFDGTQINVVQRTGTFQVAGTIAIEVDKNAVTGTNTRFRDQLKAGDRIIIRGMTHVVSHVIDQTNMTVTPDFRGVTNVTGAKAMIVFDKRTK